MAERRGNGEGHIQKNKNGTYTSKFMLGYKDNGKKNIISVTRSTKTEVLEEMRRIKIEHEKSPDLNRTISLSEFADIWFSDFKGSVEESTYSGYLYTLQKIKDGLGDIRLYDLKPMHINRYLQSILKVYIGKILEYKTDQLGQAEMTELGVLFGHPFCGALLVKCMSSRKKFNPEEVKMLIHILLSHHGKGEYGAVVAPAIPEAYAVHHIDNMDAKIAQCESICDEIEAGSITEKRPFALDNRLFKPTNL